MHNNALMLWGNKAKSKGMEAMASISIIVVVKSIPSESKSWATESSASESESLTSNVFVKILLSKQDQH